MEREKGREGKKRWMDGKGIESKKLRIARVNCEFQIERKKMQIPS